MARILVVEDNPTNLQLMLYVLRAFGYAATAAHDGLSGLKAIDGDRFDLVLCDVLMPGIDGFEFAKRYKSEVRNTAPLVAVTALAMVGDRERLLAAGFDGYIAKPIEPETFVTQIQAFLPPEAPAGPLILAIDDEKVNLDLIRSSLAPFGYRIVEARSVREGIERAREAKPALILCDMHMIGDDGFEMLRRVKMSTDLSDVPFFILSSTARGTSDRVRGLQLGATKFLTRPIEPDELRGEIEAAIRRN